MYFDVHSPSTQRPVASTTTTQRADRALHWAAASWLAVALIGQWLFAIYVALMYALPVATGNFAAASLSSHTITGYVTGDRIGNTMLFAHVLPAVLLSIGGILQLIPAMRRHFPRFHRWNGRLFLVLALLGAVSGLYLTWIRGSRLSELGALGITINGVLIPIFVALCWRAARQRDFIVHRRFAVHAFLLVNAVWTFRLYLMAWYLLNQGPNGNTNKLDGPADLTISFACYLLPMLMAELLFWAQRQQQRLRKWCVAVALSVGVLITTFGVIAAAMMMWWPRVSHVVL